MVTFTKNFVGYWDLDYFLGYFVTYWVSRPCFLGVIMVLLKRFTSVPGFVHNGSNGAVYWSPISIEIAL